MACDAMFSVGFFTLQRASTSILGCALPEDGVARSTHNTAVQEEPAYSEDKAPTARINKALEGLISKAL